MSFPAFVPIGVAPPRAESALSIELAKARAQKSSSNLRQGFTNRLGLPSDATDAQILDAVDAARAKRSSAQQASSAALPQSADDALYALAWGVPGAEGDPESVTDAEGLYAAAWGDAS